MTPTIESLEGKAWPDPHFTSSLVLTAHALRKKPLEELTPNDLRVAFKEDIGVQFLKPLALAILQKEPAIDAAFFDGDLLLAVMRSRHFCEDKVFRTKIIECADRALQNISFSNTLDEIKALRG